MGDKHSKASLQMRQHRTEAWALSVLGKYPKQVRYELTRSVALRVLSALFTKPSRHQFLFPGPVGIWHCSPSGGVEKSHPEKHNTPKDPAEAN